MKIIFTLLLVINTFGMLHDTSGIPVRIIRENEFGRYDTSYAVVKTIFTFQNYYKLDGAPYPIPKYQVEAINE